MIYFDTSFVAPLFKAEPCSADVERFVAGLAVGRMAFETFVARGGVNFGVADRDCDEARRLLSNHRSGLRAGDALHLAIASNNAAQGIYSLDKTMIAVGRSLGLPMNLGFPAADP